MQDVYTGFDGAIHPELFELYKNNFTKAVDGVFGDEFKPLSNKLKLNVSKFAAYKAYHLTKQLKSIDSSDKTKFKEIATRLVKKFNNWQATENNTVVSRSRTAKQFQEFNQPDNKIPNLEWIHTRSVNPRELHLHFVGTILPKKHPFWLANQPGNLWNCKCDVIETNKSVTKAPQREVAAAKGLEGNPAKTGDVFSDKHPYFAKAKDKDTFENFYYKDEKADFSISILADKTEIFDNIETARILKDVFKDRIDIKIRPHFYGKRNPEFEINGLIADAKRIEKYEGISNGFGNAKKQECKAVIIDFNKHFDTKKKFNTDAVIGKLLWRKEDFISEQIKECYIVYGNKAIIVKTNDLTKNKLIDLIKALQP